MLDQCRAAVSLIVEHSIHSGCSRVVKPGIGVVSEIRATELKSLAYIRKMLHLKQNEKDSEGSRRCPGG
jgi:hypothetical protein